MAAAEGEGRAAVGRFKNKTAAPSSFAKIDCQYAAVPMVEMEASSSTAGCSFMSRMTTPSGAAM